jgi:hypothetical protein
MNRPLFAELQARTEAQAKRPLMGNYQLPAEDYLMRGLCESHQVQAWTESGEDSVRVKSVARSGKDGQRDLHDVNLGSTFLISPLEEDFILLLF